MSPRPPSIRKVTPILIVDEIEPALALWTGALGYGAREIFVRDPAGNVVGFAEHIKR